MPPRYYFGPRSDHFDGERFFNPGGRGDDGAAPPRAGRLAALLRWRLSRAGEPWPKTIPSPFHDHPPERAQGLRICLIGHASLLIQTDGCNILVDPQFSQRASPLTIAGPLRVNPPGVAFERLPPIDAVLITHSHYDHLDLPSLRRLWRAHRPRILAPLGTDVVIRRADRATEVATGDWGERFALSDRVAATLVPARHWSARTLFDRNLALWCGFAIQSNQGLVYVAGDTGYGDGAIFRAFRENFGAPAAAVLPIGAYAPRWFMSAQHVDPAESVKIMRDCGAAQALGVHWGTFHLSDEGPHAPAQELAEAVRRAGIAPERFLALRPGEVWEAPERSASD